MAIIKAPNQEYTGLSAGVTFINGVGNTDNMHLIEWFKENGYEVVEEDSEDTKKVKKQSKE
jgi:hypothetical protein